MKDIMSYEEIEELKHSVDKQRAKSVKLMKWLDIALLINLITMIIFFASKLGGLI